MMKRTFPGNWDGGMAGGHPEGRNPPKPDPRDPHNQHRGLLSPFFPGDQTALAQQMAAGFGGDPQKIRGLLAQIYSPMRMGFRPSQGGGFGGGNQGQPNAPAQPIADPNFHLSPVGWTPPGKVRS